MKKQALVIILISTVAFLAVANSNPALAATNVAARKIPLLAGSRASHVYQPKADIYVAASSAVLKSEVWEIKEVDYRAEKLKAFLTTYNSPLASFARDFVAASDRYGLDWRLLPAITGVESTFGKQVPPSSYNAYGWNNGVGRFTSWPDSIDYVSCALREKYINRGLNTVAKIGLVYAPPSRTWAGRVSFFMEKIENFESPLLALTI